MEDVGYLWVISTILRKSKETVISNAVEILKKDLKGSVHAYIRLIPKSSVHLIRSLWLPTT